eukprot:CAMPEP_0184750676 /NCGR_PEP_ID=MMETSP0315-20130426/38086_1 /TAXON_ID=101924 /ORGANISM="Rhodosorus marinus, Strain UTEX LB 2760" /LENGTH=64 /DNA_ID=CAMNT_0027229151 /DNA_START=48 /DNA_END=238 /DNA_ORIENTATION=-
MGWQRLLCHPGTGAIKQLRDSDVIQVKGPILAEFERTSCEKTKMTAKGLGGFVASQIGTFTHRA